MAGISVGMMRAMRIVAGIAATIVVGLYYGCILFNVEDCFIGMFVCWIAVMVTLFTIVELR
jgi:hypothetical protein